MPANLPPLYYEKERMLKFAQSIPEKIEILQEMLAIMPKHKGTDKLQADLRAKISKLKKELKKQPATRRVDFYHIPKEGAGQIVLIGPPNTGKTALVNTLANTGYPEGDYPFTTKKPEVGMMQYEDIQIQLVDMPPLYKEFHPGWITGIARNADLLLLMFNACSKNLYADIEECIGYLEEGNIKIVNFNSDETSEDFLIKKGFIVITHTDECNAINKEEIKKRWGLTPVMVSLLDESGIEELKKNIYIGLDIIRIYTKRPHREPDMTEPVVLKKGSTVIDAAYHIHKDFAYNLRFARLWRVSESKNGIHIGRNEILKEGDIVEFHI